MMNQRVMGRWLSVVAVVLCWSGFTLAQKGGVADDRLTQHPAAEALRRAFEQPVPAGFRSTGLAKKDYLTLIAGNVDFFKQHQDEAGAIIDPHEKMERQYSTPAFA